MGREHTRKQKSTEYIRGMGSDWVCVSRGEAANGVSNGETVWSGSLINKDMIFFSCGLEGISWCKL